jgi:hypothetical protein
MRFATVMPRNGKRLGLWTKDNSRFPGNDRQKSKNNNKSKGTVANYFAGWC